jgi:hypothetical protein
MSIRGGCRWVAVVTAASLLQAAKPLAADSVKLQNGGTVAGSVTTGTKQVSVRTATGALIVFERAAVKQVVRGHSPPKSSPTVASTSSRASSKKLLLTAAEDNWVPRVHGLVSRLFGGDREKSRQARRALSQIDDVDAVPALSVSLGSSRNVEARHLYVVILHNLTGPKPVYYLVALSLFDPSPEIRADARQALRAEQLESARLFYIAALRSGTPALARRAAIALGEIGDPRGDSVPYLIDALVSYGTIASLRATAQYNVVYMNTIDATPGLKISDANLHSHATGTAPPRPARDGSGTPPNPADAVTRSDENAGQPLPSSSANSNGGYVARNADFTPSFATPVVTPMTMTGSLSPTNPIIADESYDPPKKKCGSHDRPLTGYVDHPEVLDALVKVTDQQSPGYGFNQDRWRTWWMNEKTNRDLQKPNATDGIVAANKATK